MRAAGAAGARDGVGAVIRAPRARGRVSSTTVVRAVSRRDMHAMSIVLPGLIVTSSPFVFSDDAVAAAAAVTTRCPRAEATLRSTKTSPSRVIKGCWQLSGGHGGDRATDRTRGDAAVEDFASFVDAGISTFDTGPEACGYGDSELIIGEYLKTEHARKHRDEIQVFTKLCCVGREQSNMTKDWVMANVDRPRKRLGVDKIDMVQMYWNEYNQRGYVDAALFLTDLKHKGVIDAVSLTNFDTQRMKEMLDAGAEISTNQIQYSLLDRRPEKVMKQFCESTGVGLLPYGVVAGGLLSDRYLDAPPDKVVMNTSSLRKYASVVGNVGGYSWYQSLLKCLRAVADKHNTSIANVASKWVLESPVVPAVILGARNATHIPDHLALFDFSLDDADRDSIARVLAGGEQPTQDAYTWERGGKW